MISLSRFSNNIALRLVISILLFSVAVTLISTTAQLFYEYKRDLDQIVATLDQIRKIHVTTLVPSLWVHDQAMLDTQLQGIKNLPDIACVTLEKEGKIIVGAGVSGQKNVQSYDFPLSYQHRDRAVPLGILKVDVNMDSVYQRFQDRFFIILIAEAFKIFLVSIFIFILFYYTVGKHLKTMAAYARSLNLANLKQSLKLQRKDTKIYSQDELGLVESAINSMRHNLLEEIEAVRLSRDALKQSEALFRSQFEFGNIGIAIISPELEWIRANERLCSMLGYSEEELCEKSWSEITHPEDLTAGKTRFHQMMQGEIDNYEMERRLFHKDGTVIFTHLNISCYRHQDRSVKFVIASYLDITERKRAEEKLKESEERLRFLVQNASDSLVIINADGSQRYVSPGAERITGFPIAELEGRTIDTLIHPNDLQEVMTAWNEAIEHPEKTVTVQYRHIHKTREWVFFEAIAQSFLGEPAINAVIASVRDISERKQAEDEKEKLQGQLIQAQKMESVGRLAGGVAHDFNNMLSVILGHAELAMEQMAPDPPLLAHLQNIQEAAQRSADLTRQLLAFARKQIVAPKVLELSEAVEGMLKMLRRLIGEDLDLAWLPSRNPVMVKIDPSQIDQILANLCVNARDAIGDTGKVTIETGTAAFDERYCAEHEGCVTGEYVLLAVSDNGCGMDAETISHLFEPFFTTKEMGKGTGLGLATVYGIVRQNNGFINVYSEPGQGTTFRIYLPRYLGQAEVVPKIGAADTPLRGKETILLVEDGPMILDMTTAMLELQGYKVLPAGTPGEALQLALQHIDGVHLLLTDVVMPEMNGRDLANNLQTLLPGLKCLFMSGYTANVIAHHGVLDKEVHFISKPFSLKELASKVREVLDAGV